MRRNSNEEPLRKAQKATAARGRQGVTPLGARQQRLAQANAAQRRAATRRHGNAGLD